MPCEVARHALNHNTHSNRRACLSDTPWDQRRAHSNINAQVETTTISINVMNQPNLNPGWRKALSCNASCKRRV